MEFVGKIVKKEFKGFGTVKSYNPSSGFLEIVYQDGDSEELDSSQVASLLDSKPDEETQKERARPRPGRKPKKRRRVVRVSSPDLSHNLMKSTQEDSISLSGNLIVNVDIDGMVRRNLDMVNGNEGNLMIGRQEDIINDRINQTLGNKGGFGENSENSQVPTHFKGGLDLNASFNLNEELTPNDWWDSHVISEGGLKRRDSIDLNLDVNVEPDMNYQTDVDLGCSSVGVMKRKCDFDLNMDLSIYDEIKETKDVYEEHASVSLENMSQKDKEQTFECINEKSMQDGTRDSNGSISVMVFHDSSEHEVRNASLAAVEGQRTGLYEGEFKPIGSILDSNANCKKDCSSTEVQLKNGHCDAVANIVHEAHDDSRTPYKQSSRRKRRKLSDNLKTTTEAVLRRSSRRGLAKNHVSSTPESCITNDLSLTPGVSAMPEKKATSSFDQHEQLSLISEKLQLPPPSQNLNLDDIPVLDLFSIYACLRSFSALLFLSPFELEDFVAALKYSSCSHLFDHIHVSILQTLRKHLEYLSNEGSQSASNCLRNINWDLLDLITWPIFMVEYLLIHGSGLKLGLDLTRLNLFKNEYYTQPVTLKVKILHCLCDDVIEAESIRSELNRRSSTSEPDIVFDRNMHGEVFKSRMAQHDTPGGPCLTDDIVDDMTDWNSDECCLCKMDGNLICCDGCPAAFHSKCVGITTDHLPEGDWYCPECAINRHKPWMKQRKSLRGADLLGIDPHGRLYYSSCGYLLVSDSFDSESSFSYYHTNDLNAIVEVLKSSDTIYGGILTAVQKHWGIPVNLNVVAINPNASNIDRCLDVYTSSEMCLLKQETDNAKNLEEKLNTESFNQVGFEVSVGRKSSQPVTATRSQSIISERSGETTRTRSGSSHAVSTVSAAKEDTEEVHCNGDYVNYYSFAQMASSVAEELMHKLPENSCGNFVRSEEDIVSTQAKAILKKSTRFRWASVEDRSSDAEKEKCGWCFSCKVATDGRNCLLNTMMRPALDESRSDRVGRQSKLNKKGHLMDVICRILSLEDQLSGLLLGPWLNSHHSKLWRKSVSEASDVASVKKFLLLLVSNLRPLSLSAEWTRHVDSVISMGSASHIVTSSQRTSTRNNVGRKRARCTENEFNSSSNASGGLVVFWWRGGCLSRQLFNWKLLPRSLVSKAARQAGCTKIPGILYSENSEYAKRRKYDAWQSAVESATSVEQLALQVRELDLNIRWHDIENTHHLPILDKESKKSMRLFKKAIVRRKCIEGETVKYLLDFGKRRAVPEIVTRHGSVFEESSSEKKKYWLEESCVPLHLVKNFEEKRIYRKSNEMKPGKVNEIARTKRAPHERGFSYLFSKAERSEYYQCGQCNKDVLIREAVSCQYCNGYFHKRHVRKSACLYTCQRCEGKKIVKPDKKRQKINSKRGKIQSQSKEVPKVCRTAKSKGWKKMKTKKEVPPSIPLRRSARKAKCLYVQNKKSRRGRKKGKHVKSRKVTHKKSKRDNPLSKKRTQVYHSYWLNGLQFSRKPSDERIMMFREKIHLGSSENSSAILNQPRCRCCEAEYSSTSSYIACEICREWFHADAYGLNLDNINQIIGFRCHICRNQKGPVCPHKKSNTYHNRLSPSCNPAVECSEELPNAVPPLNEIPCN